MQFKVFAVYDHAISSIFEMKNDLSCSKAYARSKCLVIKKPCNLETLKSWNEIWAHFYCNKHYFLRFCSESYHFWGNTKWILHVHLNLFVNRSSYYEWFMFHSCGSSNFTPLWFAKLLAILAVIRTIFLLWS